MKKKRTIILILQVIITLFVGLVLFTSTNKQLEAEKVYVFNITTDELSRPLVESDIKEISVPKKALSDKMEVKKENIIGKHIDRKVTAGHFVYKENLVNKEDVDIFETIDLTNKRKISLPISYVEGMSGNLKKGDRIDLAYIGGGESESGEFRYSKVFMQNIPIWSVNTGDGYRFIDKSTRTSTQTYEKESQIDSESGDGVLQIITLAVDLEQAEEILARRNAGKISFVGRFAESESYNSMGFVLGEYEKIFSGKGYAETGRTLIDEDDFEEVFKKDN